MITSRSGHIRVIFPSAAAGGRERGFSLIEVSLAIGLVAFALVAVLGALPTGLVTVQDSVAQEVTASIAQQTQAALQQLSFAQAGTTLSNNSTTTVLGNLVSKVSYYTADGVEISGAASTDPTGTLPGSSPSPAVPTGAYYAATYAVSDPTYPGSTVNATPAPTGWQPSSQSVTMTICYPQLGNIAGPRKLIYSFLIARQRLN